MKDLPEWERPRERLLGQGAEALSDRELLALLLGSGLAGRDAVELAARLIARFGSLYELSRADPHTLLDEPGMGAAKAARVAAAFQLGRRALPDTSRPRIASSADLAAVAGPLLRGLRQERVVVVVCGQDGSVLRVLTLTEGGSDRSLVPVRDVLTRVLEAGGAAFGVAHNHPSGSAEPSDADRGTTARLRAAAETVGLRFLDHLVVTDTQWRRITDGP